MNNELIKTERLCLREITSDDAELIVKWRSEPDVYKYFKNSVKITKKDHLNWFENSYLENDLRTDYMAVLNETDIPVGVFGLIISEENRKEAEVSYILGKEYIGRGYAGEALTGLALWAKEKRKIKTLVAVIHMDNTASLRFAENLGFVETERFNPFIKLKKEL